MSRLDKPSGRGTWPVSYRVTDRSRQVVSEHKKLDDAKAAVKPGHQVVRSYGLDPTHAWDDKGEMTHNRYKDGPRAPTDFFAWKTR